MALIEIEKKKNTSYNSKVNTRYVYETTIYLDDETGKKVSKRKLVGKIDPDTGTEVPTGTRGGTRKSKSPAVSAPPAMQTADLPEDEAQIAMSALSTITESMNQLVKTLEMLREMIEQLPLPPES